MELIKFLDLRKNNDQISVLSEEIAKVLKHGQLVLGPEVEEFEKKIANFCNRKFAVGVASGSDALFISLRALGVTRGDEVITTSISWIATANAIKMVGATPVFADVGLDLNIDPISIKRLISKKTKVILFVNFTGKLAKIDELIKIANENSIFLMEDGAQSFGASINDKKSGSFGIISAISHNPMKIFGALGEAGTILTDDFDLYNRVLELRYNGTIDRETCVVPSLNSRIDTIQAAVLIKTFETFEYEIESRRCNANIYNSMLGEVVKTPDYKSKSEHIFYTYTIQTDKRDDLQNYLNKKGIETKIQHKIPMPLQPAYKGSVGEWSLAKELSTKVLSLPIHGNLSKEAIEYVANEILLFSQQEIKY